MPVRKTPDILVLVSDHQLHYRHSGGSAGQPFRPRFEDFASQGLRFDRAYAVSPLCGPARRSLLTGLYPHNHGQIHNQTESPWSTPSYTTLLAQAGYENCMIGKWHAGPGTATDHHCKDLTLPGYGNPYTSDAYLAYVRRMGLDPATMRIDRLFWNNDTHRQFPSLHEGQHGYQCNGTWCGEPVVGLLETPKETHECYFLANLACQELERISQHKNRPPFCLRVDFWGPHQPYMPTQEFLDLQDPSSIPEYGNYRDDLKRKPAIYRNMNRPIAGEDGKLIIPSIFPWSDWQVIMAHAYAQTSMVDEAAWTILERLEQLQLAQDTLVVWTSDHGDALGSHGGMFDKGSFMTEETIRVPLAIRWPGHVTAGGRTQALVNSIDLAPTLLDVARVEKPPVMDGNSLVPVLGDPITPWRETMLLENHGQGFRDNLRSRTVIAGTLKYTINENDIPELYDLDADPYELENLAGYPVMASTEKNLGAALYSLRQHYGDTVQFSAGSSLPHPGTEP